MAKFDYIKFVTNHKHTNKPTPKHTNKPTPKLLQENPHSFQPDHSNSRANSRPEEDDFAFDKMDGEMYDDDLDPMESVNEFFSGKVDQIAQEKFKKDWEQLSRSEKKWVSDEVRKRTESVNEAQQPVTKSDWDTADIDQRVDWLLQVFDDPDKAEQHAETEWENLPNTAPSNMYLEGTCGYSIDGKGGDEPAGPHLFKDPKNLKESAIKLGYLKESTRVELGSLKRPIDVSIEDGVIMAGDKHTSLSKLKSITTAYATPGGRHYRDYLHTEEGQINLSGDENDFSHIASALGMEEGGNPIEFFKGFGVGWESREFDVS